MNIRGWFKKKQTGKTFEDIQKENLKKSRAAEDLTCFKAWEKLVEGLSPTIQLDRATYSALIDLWSGDRAPAYTTPFPVIVIYKHEIWDEIIWDPEELPRISGYIRLLIFIETGIVVPLIKDI